MSPDAPSRPASPDVDAILRAEIVREQPRATAAGADNLIEDMFGLNLRSLRSIWTLFRRPRDYFDAAADRDWMGRYTPSFRIWFGLYAIVAALRFLYAGENSAMADGFVELIGDDIPELDGRVFTVAFYKAYVLIVPFISIPLIALAATVKPVFPRPSTYVLRLRYAFAVSVPASFFSLVTLPTALIPMDWKYYGAVGWSVFLATFVLIAATAWRGMYSGTPKGKARMAGFLAVYGVLQLLTLVLTLIPAFIYGVIEGLGGLEAVAAGAGTDAP